MNKCKCGGTEFYAHQRIQIDVIVDENGNWIQNASGPIGFCGDDISEVGDTYGPYTCTECGAEYDVPFWHL